MVTPLVRVKKIRKKTSNFLRPHNDRYKRLSDPKWRKPKGIDSAVRRRFKGQAKMPKIGYRTNKKHRHVLPNGFLKFRVFNVGDLNMLLMHNRKYAAEIAHSVGLRKRKNIVKRAQQLNIKLLNATARIRTEDNAAAPADK